MASQSQPGLRVRSGKTSHFWQQTALKLPFWARLEVLEGSFWGRDQGWDQSVNQVDPDGVSQGVGQVRGGEGTGGSSVRGQ